MNAYTTRLEYARQWLHVRVSKVQNRTPWEGTEGGLAIPTRLFVAGLLFREIERLFTPRLGGRGLEYLSGSRWDQAVAHGRANGVTKMLGQRNYIEITLLVVVAGLLPIIIYRIHVASLLYRSGRMIETLPNWQ